MSTDIAIQTVCKYILGTMKRFKFDTERYQYPVESEENSLLSCIEDCQIFDDRSGYVVIVGSDGKEFISGNDYSLAIAYDGSRPNINYLDLPIPGVKEARMRTLSLAQQGGYNQYIWIDPNDVVRRERLHRSYVKSYNGYLIVSVTHNLGSKDIGDASLPVIMCDFVQQLIGNILMYNEDVTDRYRRFLQAIDDGHVTLIVNDVFLLGREDKEKLQRAQKIISISGGGYIDPHTFCTLIPYYNYIMWYSLDVSI